MTLKNGLAAVVICLSLIIPCAPNAYAITVTNCDNLGLGGADCTVVEENKLSMDGGNNVISQAINVALATLGSISVLIIVIAGFQFAVSQGNQEKTKKARQTILYAVVGLIVAIASTLIVNLVIDNLT